MRPISPDTKSLIDRLNPPGGFWARWQGSGDDVELLSAIKDSGEPAAIIDILPFAISQKRDVARAAAVAVQQLALGVTSRELAWLDSAVRGRSPYSGTNFYEWHKLRPEQLGLLERFGEPSLSLLGMASFHQNGYVREAAIKRLDLITSGAELPFLVLRLNDWVSNVRDVSYQAIRSRLKPEYGRNFIANLPLIWRLEEAGRADHQALIHEIDELLRSDSCHPALLESLKSEDRFIRRAGFRLALSTTSSDLAEIVRLALADDDTVVRLWAAQRVPSAFEAATLESFLDLMKRDRFMPVRREVLRIRVMRNPSASLAELRAALLDAHPSMREEARYHLRRLDQIDLAAFYRQHLLAAEGSTLVGAISGLGENGTAADDHLVVPYTSHPAGRIRRAAIRALAKLNRAAHVDIFIETLKDQIPYVSRQALIALADKTSAIIVGLVWTVFQSADEPHVKRNALSLIEKVGKWDSIFYLITAVRDSDESIAAMSRIGIQRWLARSNRSYKLPTSEQLARLGKALEESANLLDERTVEELRFLMKSIN